MADPAPFSPKASQGLDFFQGPFSFSEKPFSTKKKKHVTRECRWVRKASAGFESPVAFLTMVRERLEMFVRSKPTVTKSTPPILDRIPRCGSPFQSWEDDRG